MWIHFLKAKQQQQQKAMNTYTLLHPRLMSGVSSSTAEEPQAGSEAQGTRTVFPCTTQVKGEKTILKESPPIHIFDSKGKNINFMVWKPGRYHLNHHCS